MAKYWVVDRISGCTDEVEPFANLGDAVKQRDAWNAEDKAEQGSDGFWIIVDEDGREVV